MEVISRKTAKSSGLRHYFTSKPCKLGHIDKRFVSSCECLTCRRHRANSSYAALDTESRKRIALERATYERDYRQRNKERLKACGAVTRKAFKEKHPDYFKVHYAKNKERKKQESRAWYRENTDYANERQKAYIAKQMVERPEHMRALGRKQTSKRRAIQREVFVENVDPRRVFERDKGVCGICRKRVDVKSHWEVDHIMPISKGGTHAYANVQLSHRRCNRAKGDKVQTSQPTLFQVATWNT